MSNVLSQRQLRVGEQARHALAQILQRGEIREPALDGVVVSISEVQMSSDLKVATAYISPIGGDKDVIVAALNRNARFIRGRAAGYLRQMKFMPEFRFRIDTSYDNFEKIDRLLRSPEVARDLSEDDDENSGE